MPRLSLLPDTLRLQGTGGHLFLFLTCCMEGPLKMLCSVKQRQACGVGKLPHVCKTTLRMVTGSRPAWVIQPGLQGENLSQKTKAGTGL